ncbi:hypothetical protein [Brunnivagina elsteri]|uniref:Uncharacterized protein n=1 Tax=Brunnivagina elsteri CCALA 953 TaxID=987040 RepID=A0A2A2TDY0_9CYAN|nr:hypothetical protein [Calothrix elsteri]PAX52007.1 hypothetical protein CK510_21630 [Calothrix elsteri CCALA 953]
MTEFILSGTEETLKPTITLLVAIYQMLEDRDIGQFVGQPLVENVQTMPHTSRLKLILSSVKSPPLKAPIGQRLIQAEYQIPDINPKKITWQGVKDVCGGSNGFMWGNWLASANLDNGRQMQAYGSNADEADNMMDRMLTLTSAKVLSRGCTELKKVGRRAKGQGLYREPTRVYPVYFYIVNTKRINRVETRMKTEEMVSKKRSKLRGDYLERGTSRIPLYTSKQPPNFSAIMRKALDFSSHDDS